MISCMFFPFPMFVIPQIALAIGVLTSSLGGEGSQILWIRCGGDCHTGSRRRCRLVCVGVRVRLSHRVSLAVSSGMCRGQGSQIQDRSSHRVSLEVQSSGVRGGQRFADLREGCHRGCHWRCHLMRVRVRIRSTFFHSCLVIFYIYILVCLLPRNIHVEEDLSCESA